ncbi:hypothetical protein M5E87_20470 [Flavonifractor plautii]|nr:hypothetical protein M5E87_20470 [Flavonifractor plautii]
MELNVDEALRYLGIGGQAAESIRASVAAVADKLTAAIQPRYTYRVCSLQKQRPDSCCRRPSWSFRARTQRKCWSSAIRPC